MKFIITQLQKWSIEFFFSEKKWQKWHTLLNLVNLYTRHKIRVLITESCVSIFLNSYRLRKAAIENMCDSHNVQQIDNTMVKLLIFSGTQNHLSMEYMCFNQFCFDMMGIDWRQFHNYSFCCEFFVLENILVFVQSIRRKNFLSFSLAFWSGYYCFLFYHETWKENHIRFNFNEST